MEKIVYLIFQEPEFDGAELRTALLEKAVPTLRKRSRRGFRADASNV